MTGWKERQNAITMRPVAQSADAVISTVIDHVKRGNSSLEKVFFVLYEDQAQKAFSEVLKRLSGIR